MKDETGPNFIPESFEIVDSLKIEKLTACQVVRRRPWMYFGPDSPTAKVNAPREGWLMECVKGLLCPSLEMAKASPPTCTEIALRLNADGSLTIRDDGFLWEPLHLIARGISELPAPGGTITSVAVVNFVAKRFRLETSAGGAIFAIEFGQGEVNVPWQQIADGGSRGTEVTFLPDPIVFDDHVNFDATAIEQLVAEFSAQHSNLSISLYDARPTGQGAGTEGQSK